MFWVGIALVILLSFVAIEGWAPGRKRGFRFDLIKRKRHRRIMRSRWFQPSLQIVSMAVFAFLIYAGLAGNRIGNVAPVFVWTIWWALLVFSIALAGPLFCMVCPWDGFANLVTRFGIKRRRPINLGLTLPKAMQNMYPAIAMFVLLTWLELGFGVTTDPRGTAYLALIIVGLAVAYALLFKGEKAFCKTACLVGRVQGIYANFSPVEVRARNPKTCEICVTEDCLHGNENGYPCPTGISLKESINSTYCTMCTECVKSCNYQNVAFNIRPFSSDLAKIHKPRLDEAWMAIILLSLTAFHGLTMTPLWESYVPGEQSVIKTLRTTMALGKIDAFSVGMVAAMALPILLYFGASAWSARLAKTPGVTTRTVFVKFAYSLLPVALFYHMAHNLMHLLMEGGHIVPAISDPLGRGDNWFGTADMQVGSFISQGTLSVIQVALIVIGHIIGIVVAHHIGRKLIPDRKRAMASQVPMVLLMILFSVCSMTLIHMDMNMRVGRM